MDSSGERQTVAGGKPNVVPTENDVVTPGMAAVKADEVFTAGCAL
jgi:hypothetical protein